MHESRTRHSEPQPLDCIDQTERANKLLTCTGNLHTQILNPDRICDGITSPLTEEQSRPPLLQ